MVAHLLTIGGRACIEPLFVGRTYLEVYASKPTTTYDQRSKAVTTSTSGFAGLDSNGMGFARIYDVRASIDRVVAPAIETGLQVKIVMPTMNGESLPDMRRYAFPRRSINSPLRMLQLSK